MNIKLTLILRQFTTQKAAQRHCAVKLTPEALTYRFGPNTVPVVNQLDSNVFQVELCGEFRLPDSGEIDLIGL